MEFDEGLAPSAGTDLTIGHDSMTGQGPAVGHPPGQDTLVDGRTDPGHDPCAPARGAFAVVPAVHRRPWQADAAERDVMDREAQMSGGHDPTVAARTDVARAWTSAYHAGMAPQRSNEEIVDAYLRAMVDDDEPAMGALRHRDWVADYPQSGERIRGHADERAIAANYPGGLPAIAPDQVVGSEDRWVVSPSFTYERIVGSGDAWFIRGTARYPDGSTWHVASIYRLRDGLIAHEITYWAEPFAAPAWRAEWVEPIPPE